MIFENFLPKNHQLILVRIETRSPPTLPLMARRVSPAGGATEPLLLTVILWLCIALGRLLFALRRAPDQFGVALVSIRNALPPPIWAAGRGRLAVLMFLAGVVSTVILENLAAGYIQKMLGALC